MIWLCNCVITCIIFLSVHKCFLDVLSFSTSMFGKYLPLGRETHMFSFSFFLTLEVDISLVFVYSFTYSCSHSEKDWRNLDVFKKFIHTHTHKTRRQLSVLEEKKSFRYITAEIPYNTLRNRGGPTKYSNYSYPSALEMRILSLEKYGNYKNKGVIMFARLARRRLT